MIPSRPYLLRGLYEWMCDNGWTPYLAVNATVSGTQVPLEFVKDGQIVLNIAPHAIGYIHIENDMISLSARFGGVSRDLFVPMEAAVALYARENNQGMTFPPEDFSIDTAAVSKPAPKATQKTGGNDDIKSDDEPTPPPKGKKPAKVSHLKIVK